jgi:outer membrane protein TolC
MNRAFVVVAAVAWAGVASAEEPLTLSEAAKEALRHGPAWAAAKAEDQEADAGARAAGDAFHPEGFFTTSPGYASGFPVGVAGRLPAIASVEVRETLLDPSRRSEAFSARAKRAAARGVLLDAEGRVLTDVVAAYVRAWLDSALARGAEAREAAKARLVERSEALAREGRLLPVDLERARLALARARQEKLDALSDQDLDALELAHLLGRPEGAPPLPEDLGASLPEVATLGTLEKARGEDPRLRVLPDALEATARARRELERRFVPVVEADAQYARLYKTADYDQFYSAFKADDWSVGVSVAVPLFTGGRKKDEALRVQASYDRLLEERREREFGVGLAAEKALASHARARARLSLAERASSIAEAGLSVARAQEGEGRGDAKDVAEAESALGEARDEVARATAGEVLARAELLRLRGELGSALGLERP